MDPPAHVAKRVAHVRVRADGLAAVPRLDPRALAQRFGDRRAARIDVEADRDTQLIARRVCRFAEQPVDQRDALLNGWVFGEPPLVAELLSRRDDVPSARSKDLEAVPAVTVLAVLPLAASIPDPQDRLGGVAGLIGRVAVLM